MNKEIYKNIIENSKIAYLKITCTKDCHNKFTGIKVIESNEEFERLFKILTENNILNKDIIELIINNWINNKFTGYKFNEFIERVVENGYERLCYTIELKDKKVITDVYYLEDYFMLIYNVEYNEIKENKIIKLYSWIKDLNGTYLDNTDENSHISKYNNIIGKKDEDIWGENQVKQFRKNEEEVISSRSVKTFYQVITNKNNKKLYLESTIWPLFDENNEIIGTKGSSIEIDDKLALEKSIEKNEENFREITKYSDSVFIIRDKKRATYVSPSFEHVFESNPNDLYKDINKLEDYFKRVGLNDNTIYTVNYDKCNEGTGKVKLDNGKEKWIWYKFLPITDSKGNITKRVGILTDVTEKKKVEDEKTQLKLDFFANLSHELRTPINLISSTIQLIKLNLSKLPPEEIQKFDKYMDIMEVNSLRLIKLINNLLDSTKIEEGFAAFQPIGGDIIGFIENICDSIVQHAQLNKMNIIFDTDSEEELVLFDPDIIERILLNLLSNAIKFNKINGNIYVNVYTKNDKITISVKDEGVGIPPERVSNIFERFEQVQSNKKLEKQGSGIGLYLVKSLVKLHKGSISIKSEINKGSDFIVSIPKIEVSNRDKIIRNNEENRYKRVNIEFSDI